jgi:cellobiose phosphorylase
MWGKKMKKRNIALGFYQESSTAKSVLAELKKQNFSRFATIYHKYDHSIEINRYFPFSALLIPFIGAISIVCLILLKYFSIIDFSWLAIVAGVSTIIATVGIYAFWRFSQLIDSDIINCFKNRVIVNEILIIAQVNYSDVREVLAILREVKSGHPVTFLLRPAMFEEGNVDIPSELMTMEMLREKASKLAISLQQTSTGGVDGRSLIKRLKKSHQMLQVLRRDIADAEYIEQTIPSSAEWLLDNMYVLEGGIEDVKLNMPKKYYKELPKILNGPLTGLPRIYALAIELVKNTGGGLNRENITHFLDSYQSGDHPLTMGELWAFPLMLRLRLIEWVEFLAIHVDNRMREGELASFWGNRLLNAAHHDPKLLPIFLADLSNEQTSFSGHFGEELLDHLFDEEAILPMVRKWLEERFRSPLDEILHQEHLDETSEQVVFSSAIRSLITLSQLSWPDIFETVNPVDTILREDFTGIYSKMDFTTRNCYRETIEEIARRVNLNEVEIAKITLSFAHEGVKAYEQHVGYYLIDAGRQALEQRVGYHPTIFQSINRWIIKNPASVYLGGIALMTLLLESVMFSFFFKANLNFFQITLFLIFSLLPISELSTQFVNLLLTILLPTPLRPKMLFETGIPPEYKTLVVVPMMLMTPESIREEINRLEIRYLANTDPLLSFGLFSDFSDAKEQHAEIDVSLLKIAVDGLQALENKYGEGKFFLFHRQRVWSKSENAWIGWERKRGKLEYLNRFLMGETLPENIVYMGNANALKGTRYVITLDADTQLPKDQARALVEVLSHPLNRPYLTADKNKLERGYTIIQPRVGTDFIHAKASWFCKIFSEPTAVDPYTQAISNVYQDLVGEGSYHGKGIYDVEAFHSILSQHFPEEHLLSHDLIEGAFVRVGFASHICLFDIHPKDYLSWAKRQHRWMRGDWQIIDWLLPKVPMRNGKTEVNTLSWLNRWKIFDNLRRALLPIALVVLLTAGWAISPVPGVLTGLALFVLLLPSISLCISKLCTYSFFPIKSFLIELKFLSLRSLITIALLPFEAFLSLDAMLRVAFRRLISHQNLLQWTTGEYSCNGLKTHQKFVLQVGWVSFFAVMILGTVISVDRPAELIALPFCLLWIAAPYIIHVIDKPLDKRRDENLSNLDKQILRKIGRKTWRYFDELVGAHTHWLPPDNFQTALNIEIAQRTSPTNIGMWLLAVMNAYDFKYITCDIFIDKTSATLHELKKLERYEGHFLNWYNIQTLDPLFPRYVSTVDSGNFLACIWTLKQGMDEMISSSIIPTNALLGIKDTFDVLQETNKSTKIEEAKRLFDSSESNDLSHFIAIVKDALKVVQGLSVEKVEAYWLKQIEEQLMGWESTFSRYFSWVEILSSLPLEHLHIIDPQASRWRVEALSWQASLEMLANKKLLPALDKLVEAAQRTDLPNEIKAWGKKLQEALATAQWLAGEKIGQVAELIKEIELFSQEMDLKFLYNSDRKLFAIGYNVDVRKLDTSYYDLLASEARIASLVAIAKEDVPVAHWWALGRLYSIVRGRKVLLSWGGTMFEYLMPLIFTKHYSDSLIGEACHAAVDCQIDYGKQRGIPWGISESAFSAIDSYKIYQYKSFGVPGLGLKRGLEDDLVVSPYSTVLALVVKAKSAIKNLKKMAEKKHLNLMGSYGYYESMDFTRQKSPAGERGVIVYVYMAHHQGMIFATINNILNNEILINRFQKDPRICGVSSLLYERIPFSPPIKITSGRKEPILRRLEPFSKSPIMGVVETTESVTPKINLLSNEKYSLMITNTGGGYSRWGDIEIYRWRADTTRDSWGNFCYIKDMKSGEVWSAAYQPTQTSGKEFSVNFKGDKAEFRRKDHQIETLTEIVVSPEDNAEIRLITLINHSNETRYIELTSYLELSLAPHLTDRAHPCFNKLFIETEAMPEAPALLGFRRLRSPNDLPIWAVHVLATNPSSDGGVQYETDRDRFIGRGKSLKHPAALEGDLSNTTGTVLDPIFSLRGRVVIEPGRRVQLSFVTAVSDNRTSAIALIEKYKDIAASHRAIELAWNYAQLELRHLRIHQEEVQLFLKLASRLIYPHVQFRSNRLHKNRLGQSGLWGQGISGDWPIVVVTVGDIYDVDLVKQLLIAHAFWSLRGLKVDLIIFNEEETGYTQPLEEHLQSQVQAHSYRNQINKPGGVFLRNTDQMSPDELNLIFSVAHAVLIASRGLLRQQLVSPKSKVRYPPKLIINEKVNEEPSQSLPFLELPYFNGLGGYTADGRSYVIYLGPNTNTPAPWINVLSNPQFGTLVSEAGLGCTWYGNSQTNRLTPWSNDPLLNPISDTIYIRDEEMGTVWTPTPAPIRELDAYRISHSQGYTSFEHNSHGINQELLVFVPVNDEGGLPLRIQRLRLTNHSSQLRRLTVTAYTEWVLGGDKEETQIHVITEWDSEGKALFACNRYHPDFGGHVAFSCSTRPIASYSGDRAEFIGRNRSTASPEALSRKSLSGHTGGALDPCSALQVLLEIDPGKEEEVVFIMGYAPDAATARQFISQCRIPGKIDQLLSDTQSWWDKTLETIQIDVPDQATNFLMNRWLIYQDLSCRFWGRTAFYQSSGAYGFRDQLQDTMALVYFVPNIAREYILKAASRQFVEGDVQHWWHPQSGAGIRTRCSDDFLWLPFVTAHYIRITGDIGILEEKISFLEGDKLADDQEEIFQDPKISKETESLLEHCRRAIYRGMTAGPHGLPLIGTGDWNDGMNLVGIHGKGESVWLAWFLIHVMHDFADLLTFSSGNKEAGEGFRVEAKRLAQVVEATAWDGSWYRRAYFDDGTPLGSKENSEAFIDSLPQSWAVIAGLANPERIAMALNSAGEYLVKAKDNLVLLLTPPFDKMPLNPGYIKGYPPGVRENGGQYTHGASWLALAYARTGNGNKAADLLRMVSPILHTSTAEANKLYKVEPYVIAADIYDLKNQVGRGGWTWYTGSACWVYRVWLEEILGFKLRGQTLSLNCSIPKEWDQFKLQYRYKTSHYEIIVTNPHHLNSGIPSITLDGVLLSSQEIPLIDDGGQHTVNIVLKPFA